MRIHQFSPCTAFSETRHPKPSTSMGLSLDDFRKINGGDFIEELPRGFRPCHPGFEPYRCADGSVIGVAPD